MEEASYRTETEDIRKEVRWVCLHWDIGKGLTNGAIF